MTSIFKLSINLRKMQCSYLYFFQIFCKFRNLKNNLEFCYYIYNIIIKFKIINLCNAITEEFAIVFITSFD